MSTRFSASKKQPLQLKVPSDSELSSDDDQEYEVAVVSPSTVSTVTTDSYLDNCTTTTEGTSIKSQQRDAVDFIDEEPLILKSAGKVIEDLEKKVEELADEIELDEEEIAKKKTYLKGVRKELKKWQKRVSTPTTAENAQFVVVVNQVNRQIHNYDDGTLFYNTETSKTQLRLSAHKVSTKSVRDAGKTVVDGKKKVSVHVKDSTVTATDLAAAKETELLEASKSFN